METVILKVNIFNSLSSESEIAKVWGDRGRIRKKNDYCEIWHFLDECTLALCDWLWVTLYDQSQAVWASVLSETLRGEKGLRVCYHAAFTLWLNNLQLEDYIRQHYEWVKKPLHFFPLQLCVGWFNALPLVLSEDTPLQHLRVPPPPNF